MKSVFDELKDSNQQIYAFFNDALYFKSSFWLTHTVTHTGKRADGTNGRKSAGEHGAPDKRGHKRSGKQKTSSFQSVGKDEVSGSNPDSSSTKPALFVWKGRFCFAFRNFLACLKFAIRPLTTEQATDRKNQGSGGAIPPEPCAFQPAFACAFMAAISCFISRISWDSFCSHSSSLWA